MIEINMDKSFNMLKFSKKVKKQIITSVNKLTMHVIISFFLSSVNILLAFIISCYISQPCWEVGQCDNPHFTTEIEESHPEMGKSI